MLLTRRRPLAWQTFIQFDALQLPFLKLGNFQLLPSGVGFTSPFTGSDLHIPPSGKQQKSLLKPWFFPFKLCGQADRQGTIEPCWGIVMCTLGPVLGWELRVICTMGISQLHFSTVFLNFISPLKVSTVFLNCWGRVICGLGRE